MREGRERWGVKEREEKEEIGRDEGGEGDRGTADPENLGGKE